MRRRSRKVRHEQGFIYFLELPPRAQDIVANILFLCSWRADANWRRERNEELGSYIYTKAENRITVVCNPVCFERIFPEVMFVYLDAT